MIVTLHAPILFMAVAMHGHCSSGLADTCTEHEDIADGLSTLQIRSPTPPLANYSKEVAFGEMITHEDWESKYDFLVQVWLKGGKYDSCSGLVWGDKVLTAQRCALLANGSVSKEPHAFFIYGANFGAKASAVDHDPFFQGESLLGAGHDFTILTLPKAYHNKQRMALQKFRSPVGDILFAAGFGMTSANDQNPHLQSRPVISTEMRRQACPRFAHPAVGVDCTYSHGQRPATCPGDTGGPWMRWDRPEVESSPTVAVIAGVHSFKYGGSSCDDYAMKNGYGSTLMAYDWIENVVPGHFIWIDKAS